MDKRRQSTGHGCGVVKAEADAAAIKAKAEADALRTKEEAAKAEAERNRKAAEDLRNQLLEKLNHILPTTDTPRGLVVNMGDVLFDFGKYDLRPEAPRETGQIVRNCAGASGLEPRCRRAYGQRGQR